MKIDPLFHEENFHGKDRKESRKERKEAARKDRSKFKKSDQKEAAPPIDATLPQGRVVAITGEGAYVQCGGEMRLLSVRGFLKKERTQKESILAVGDIVQIEDSAIASISPRTSSLSRTSLLREQEQILAANVDQMVVIASASFPLLKPTLIDRYLIAAERGNIHPIIVLNKVDDLPLSPLYNPFLLAYEPLGIPILSTSVKTNLGLDALKELLQKKTTVFAGQSGVGKSSLLNALFGLSRKVGDLAIRTDKGSHTTTMAEMIEVGEETFLIDTPGIKSFGLFSLAKEEVVSHFREFPSTCRFSNCRHDQEPGCAVLEALEKGEISALRYHSFRQLYTECAP